MLPFGDLHNDFGGIAFALGWLLFVIPFAIALIFITKEMAVNDEERLQDEIKKGVHKYAASYTKSIVKETKQLPEIETSVTNSPLIVKIVGFVAGILITIVTVQSIYGDGNTDITSVGLVIMWGLYFLTQGVLWWVALSQGKQDVYQDVTTQRRL